MNWAFRLIEPGEESAAVEKAEAALAALEAIGSPHAEMVRRAIEVLRTN